ncbi:MAG: hypothetical protein KJ718_04490 [Nanoarchaeota archaeon]|nr:hypothetical protein [Nanoarchaeota archaeon]MBU1051787.1 hypothetical protein [Nanoarchaeota archaeon]MBU1988225.1 hypothetical protein [Nanoarchaeota archaeon]
METKKLNGGEKAKEKVKNSENLNKNIKEGKMAIRKRIKGECVEVRERNTSAGKKGTIVCKCSRSDSYVKAKNALKRLRNRN